MSLQGRAKQPGPDGRSQYQPPPRHQMMHRQPSAPAPAPAPCTTLCNLLGMHVKTTAHRLPCCNANFLVPSPLSPGTICKRMLNTHMACLEKALRNNELSQWRCLSLHTSSTLCSPSSFSYPSVPHAPTPTPIALQRQISSSSSCCTNCSCRLCTATQQIKRTIQVRPGTHHTPAGHHRGTTVRVLGLNHLAGILACADFFHQRSSRSRTLCSLQTEQQQGSNTQQSVFSMVWC